MKVFETANGAERAAWRAMNQTTGGLDLIGVSSRPMSGGFWGVIKLCCAKEELTIPDRNALKGFDLHFLWQEEEVEAPALLRYGRGATAIMRDIMARMPDAPKGDIYEAAREAGIPSGQLNSVFRQIQKHSPPGVKVRQQTEQRRGRSALERVPFAGPPPWLNHLPSKNVHPEDLPGDPD